MTESVDATTSICPWCSADVPVGRENCPACGANLVETGESAVPGVTAIDPEAVLRSVRTTGAPQRRNRILSLITGEEPDDTDAVAGSPTALAPPPPDVRREMLRMEIAAELSNLTAEADSFAADDAVDATAEASTVEATAIGSSGEAPLAVAHAAAEAEDEVAPEPSAERSAESSPEPSPEP